MIRSFKAVGVLSLCVSLFALSSPAWAVGPGGDSTPPEVITPLVVSPGALGNEVSLSWTNPVSTDVQRFVVRYATYYIVTVSTNWFRGKDGVIYDYVQAWATGTAGGAKAETVVGLTEGATYYFGVAAQDMHNNLSTGVAVGGVIVPKIWPTAISDLTANPVGTAEQGTNLVWTATGDDGTTGLATTYRIYRATLTFQAPGQGTVTVIVAQTSSGFLVPKAPGVSESYVNPALSAGATYYFMVEAADEAGNFAYSNVPFSLPRADTTAPLAITQIAPAIGAADSSVDVTWTAPPDQNGGEKLIPTYIINYSQTPFPGLLSAGEVAGVTTPMDVSASVLPTSRITVAVTGLQRRSVYFFTVRPKDEAGNVGSYFIVQSTTARDLAAPQTMGAVTISTSAGGGRADLSWTAPADDGVSTGPAVASYKVVYATYAPADAGNFFNGAEGSIVVANKTGSVAPGQTDSLTVKDLAGPATAYYFVVAALDAAGNQATVTAVSISTSAAVANDTLSPDGVSNFAGSRDASVKTTINFTWTTPADSNSAVTAYTIRWSTGAVSLFPSATDWWYETNGPAGVVVSTALPAGPPSESFALAGMTTSQAVYAMLRSNDAVGNVSPLSNSGVEVVVPAVVDTALPGQVTDLAVSTTSIAAVTGTYVNLAAPGPIEGNVELTWTAPGDDGNAGTVTSMLVRYNTAGIASEADWNDATPSTAAAGIRGAGSAPSVLAPGLAQSYVLSGLTVGTTYYFAVRGQDLAGQLGALSNGPLTSSRPNEIVSIAYLMTVSPTGTPSRDGEYYAVGPSTVTNVLTAKSGIIADVSGRAIQARHNVTSFLGSPNHALSGRLRHVLGKISHFNGQFQLDDARPSQAGWPNEPDREVALPAPVNVTSAQLQAGSTDLADPNNAESREGTLVALRGVQGVAVATNTWPVGSSSVNYMVYDDTGGPNQQIIVRFEGGNKTSGLAGPDPGVRFDVIGTQGQYDPSSPYFSGYQVFPPSNPATTQNLGVIERTRNLAALPGNNSVTLTWGTVTDADRNGFEIYASALPPPGAVWLHKQSVTAKDAGHATVTTGLTAGTTYYFHVAMKQAIPAGAGWAKEGIAGKTFLESGEPLANGLAIGEAAWVGFGDAADTTAPNGVTNLAGQDGGIDGAVALTWTAPGDDGAAGTATKYIVRFASWSPAANTTGWWDGSMPPSVAGARPVESYRTLPAPLAQGTSQAMTLSGLMAGATYYVAMRALDDVGNVSTLSNIIGVPASNIAPPAPTGLSISPVSAGVTLTWTAPVLVGGGPQGEDVPVQDLADHGYRIYYSVGHQGWGVITGGDNLNVGANYPSAGTGAYDVVVTTVAMKTSVVKSANTRAYTILGLQNGVTAYFVVAAVDNVGNVTGAAEGTGLPVAPANVKITEVMLVGPNDQGVTGSKKDQFIEIYNASDQPADISLWQVYTRSLSSSFNDNFIKAKIPPGTVLGPRQHYVIGFVENTGMYRAGLRSGIVYPLADYDWGYPRTLDAANEKSAWADSDYAGGGFSISYQGSNITLLPPRASLSAVNEVNMKFETIVDRITFRTDGGTTYKGFKVESDGIPDPDNGFPGGGKNWPDGNGQYLDTETNLPSGVGPLFSTRASSWTYSFQRKDDDVDNDRLDDWTVGIANPGSRADATAPAPIENLTVSGVDTAGGLVDGVDGGLRLAFTAPGDDGTLPGNLGKAFMYLVNYATWFPTGGDPASLDSWLNASRAYTDKSPRTVSIGGVSYTGPSWMPQVSGTQEIRRVASAALKAGERYVFLVRAMDEVGNILAPTQNQFHERAVGFLRLNPALIGRFLAAEDIGVKTLFTRVNPAAKTLERTPGHLADTGNPDLGESDKVKFPAGAFAYNAYTAADNVVTFTLKKDGNPLAVPAIAGGVKVGATPVTATGNSFTTSVDAFGSLPDVIIGDRSLVKMGDAVNVPDQVDIAFQGVTITRYNDSSPPSKPGEVENTVKPVADSAGGTITGSKGSVEPFSTVVFYGQNPAGKTRTELTALEIKAAPGRSNGAPYAAFASTGADTNGGFPTTSVGTKASTVYVVVKDAAGNLSPAFLAPFLPTETKLDAIGPNPLVPSKQTDKWATVWFNLKETTNVNLIVFNADGELVKTLLDNQSFNAGFGRAWDANGTVVTADTPRPKPTDAVTATLPAVAWDGTNEAGTRVASGVYLVRFEAGGVKTTKKMLVIQ